MQAVPRVRFRAILAAGFLFALYAGVMSHLFTVATGRALWTLEADPSASFSYVMLMNQIYWVSSALLIPGIFRVSDRFHVTSDRWRRPVLVHVLRPGSGQARLVLRVIDSGVGLASGAIDRLNNGVGLSNTRARLEHLYGDAHRFSFSSPDSGGVIVEIELPLCVEERADPQPSRAGGALRLASPKRSGGGRVGPSSTEISA